MKRFFFFFLFTILAHMAMSQLNVNYYLNQGRRYLQAQEYREAIPYLNTAISARPNEAEGYFLRAYAKYLLGDLLGAEKDLNKTIEFRPNALRAYDLRGIIRINLEKYTLAQTDFARAHKLQPSNPNFLIYEGYCHMQNKNYESALDRLNKSMELVTDNPKAYYYRGLVNSMREDTLKAVADYSRTIHLDPDYVEAYLNRGLVYYQHQKFSKAIKDYNKVIEIEPLNEQAYINRGLANYREGDFDKALADLDTALVLNKQNALAYFNRALIKNHIGLHNAAIQDLNTLAKIQPENLLTYFNRGIIKMELDDLKGAFLDFTKCIDLFPDFAKAYQNRAYVRQELKDTKGAYQDRLKAQEIAARYKQYDNGEVNYADTSASFQRLMTFQTNQRFYDRFGRQEPIRPIDIVHLTAATETKDDLSLPESQKLQGFRWTTQQLVERVDSNSPILSAVLKARNEGFFNRAEDMLDSLLQTKQDSSFWVYTFLRGNTRYLMAMQLKTMEEKEHLHLSEYNNSSTMAYDLQQEVTYEGWEDARMDYQLALREKPNHPYIWYNMGNAFLQERQYRRAIHGYSQAIRLAPEFHQALFNRGLTFIYLKQTENGCMDMSKAGELGNEKAYEVIQRYCE
ncbi:MAG: tetratricopeptide repeat protein [Bacteroidota bacterium]